MEVRTTRQLDHIDLVERARPPAAGDASQAQTGSGPDIRSSDLPVAVVRGRGDEVVTVTRRWRETTGLSELASRHDGWLAGFPHHHHAAIVADIETVIATGAEPVSEWRLLRRDGTDVWVQARTAREPGLSNADDAWVMVLTELTQSTSDVAELTYRALHDPLTGLANRQLLEDRTAHALSRRRAEETSVALLFVDLDGFKSVNDAFGHATGDRVLSALARRVNDCLRPSDTAARVGGDEFVVLCEELARQEDIGAIARRVLAAAAEPLRIGDEVVRVRASVGVSFGTSGETFASLLDRADRAMFDVKKRGGDDYSIA